MATSESQIVYGARAIGAIINEPNDRIVYYKLERGYIPGSWKAGQGWALTVPVFHRAIGLDQAASAA